MKKALLYFGVLQVVLALVVAVNAQSTNLTFSVPNAIIPDLVAACDANYPRLPSELPAGGATNAAFVKRCTRQYFWSVLVNVQRRRAAEAAATSTAGDDFGN